MNRFRTLLRDRSAITNLAFSVVGLSVGIACCILIFLYARSEFAVNDLFSRSDRIYRLDSEWRESDMGIPITTLAAAGPTIVREFPEAVEKVRIYLMTNTVRVMGESDGIPNRVRDDNEPHPASYRVEVMMADSTLFRMFDLPFKHGIRETSLDQPRSVVLSKRFAETAFGSAGAKLLGHTVSLETWNSGWQDYTVTGILEDAPPNAVTDFIEGEQQDLIIPPTPYGDFFGEGGWTSWYSRYILQFVELTPGASAAGLQSKLDSFVETYAPADFHGNLTIRLNPLTDFYLTDNQNRGWRVIRMLGVIGILILLIACINFINLATAQSFSRVGEVGVRKALGAGRHQLVAQFLSESMLTTFVAATLGLAFAATLVTPFFDLLGKELVLETPIDSVTIGSVFALALLTGLVAGVYPAVVLSSFKPSRALRGHETFRPSVLWLRRGLVVIQFAGAIVLLISVYAISQQLSFITDKDLGFDRENVLVIQSVPRQFDAEGLSHARTARRHIREAVPAARNVSLSWGTAGERGGGSRTLVPAGRDRDQALSVAYQQVDASFYDTFGIELVAGRLFEENSGPGAGGEASPSTQDDPGNLAGVILTEQAATAFGWEPSKAVGQLIQIGFAPDSGPVGEEPPPPPTQEIIGVVEDVHFESLHQPIRPLVYFSVEDESMYRILSVKVAPGASSDLSQAIEDIGTAWAEVFPTAPFDYYFLDDNLDQVYHTEQQVRRLAGVGAALALFIACLGMLGLASLSLGQRTKEIGVRKVLGATVPNIVRLLSRDIVQLVITAMVIAAPISYLIIDRWLQNFAYHIDVPWQAFLIAGVAAIGLAWLTVSFHSIRAAVADPIESLRYE